MEPGATFPHSQEWFARTRGLRFGGGGCLAPANHTVGSSERRSGETYGLAGSSTAVLRITSAASMAYKKKAFAALFLLLWMRKCHFQQNYHCHIVQFAPFYLTRPAATLPSGAACSNCLPVMARVNRRVGERHWECDTALWRDGWPRYQDGNAKRPGGCRVHRYCRFVFVFVLFERLQVKSPPCVGAVTVRRGLRQALVLGADRRSPQWRTTTDILYIAADQRQARRQQLTGGLKHCRLLSKHQLTPLLPSRCVSVYFSVFRFRSFICLGVHADVDGAIVTGIVMW